ncbi:MAG: hypothetical protein ACP5HM_10490 [Anaerolineae bacterium]
MDVISYQGWETCYRLSNGVVELVVTGEVGPRVIRFGFVEDVNEFWEAPALLGKSGGDAWVNYGGHRLWHAPEAEPRTYAPDNEPVKVEEHEGFVRFIQPVEASTGIEKALDIRLDAGTARVEVIHRLRNTNLWTVRLAPWALSVMAPGGTAVVPLPPRGPHPENLAPTGRLALWAYTDMRDPRWTWGTRFILLRQDPQTATPQKVGVFVPDGWAAYARAGHLFVKTFEVVEEASYPDLGVNVETFTNAEMLELETLAPLVDLAPGTEATYVERWHLFDGVPAPTSDEDVAAQILPLLEL